MALRSILQHIRVYRRRARFRQERRIANLSISDYVNFAMLMLTIASLGVAIYALRISKVALEHADQSGDETIRQLQKQEESLKAARDALDISSQTLAAILKNAHDQIRLGLAQQMLQRKQLEAEDAQVNAYLQEVGRKPLVVVGLSCLEPVEPMSKWLIEPRQLKYIMSAEPLDSTTFTINQYRESDKFECKVLLENNGNLNASSVTTVIRIGSSHAFNQGVNRDHRPLEPSFPPPYAGVHISTNTATFGDKDGVITIAESQEVVQSRLTKPYEIPIQIFVDWTIDTFDLDLNVKGTNFPTKSLKVHFVLKHPQDPSRQ